MMMRGFNICHLQLIMVLVVGIVQGHSMKDASSAFSANVEALDHSPIMEPFGNKAGCEDKDKVCDSSFECCDGNTCHYSGNPVTRGLCKECLKEGTRCDGAYGGCCWNVTRCQPRQDSYNFNWYCEVCKREGEECRDHYDCCAVNEKRAKLRCRFPRGQQVFVQLTQIVPFICQACKERNERCDDDADCCGFYSCIPKLGGDLTERYCLL